MRYRQLHPNSPKGFSYLLEDRLSRERKMLLLLGNQHDRTRMEDQIDKRMNLDHPHLLPIGDVSWRGRRLGVVTRQLWPVASKGSPIELRLTLALRYTEALSAGHRRGLVAGWVSPQDFFLDDRKEPILGLFLDRLRESRQKNADVLRYVAPEALTRNQGSPKSDIYSLGLSLYRLFAGRAAFENSRDNLLHLKRTAQPIPPIALDNTVPERVSSMILQMADPDPELRPDTSFVTQVLSEVAGKPKCEIPRSVPVFVGRRPMLRDFSESLARPATSAPLTWILNGPSGIGKTRLLQRLLLVAQLRRRETLHIRSAPGDSSFGALSRLVDNQYRDPADSTDDPFESWIQLLRSAFRTESLVIAVDDAQWMDQGTSEVLRRLLMERNGWLLICNVRSDLDKNRAWTDFRHSISFHRQIKDWEIDPLGILEVRSILHDVTGSRPTRQRVVEMLDQSEGNPFFLLEALRSSTPSLSIQRALPISFGNRPPSAIATILRRRLERLGPTERAVIHLLTVAERPVAFEILARILGTQSKELENQLQNLRVKGLIRMPGTLSGMHVNCSHDWIAWISREVFGGKDNQLEADLAKTLEEHAEPSDFPTRAISARHFLRSGCFNRGMQLTRKTVPELCRLGLFEEASRLADEVPKKLLFAGLESDQPFMKSVLESYMRTGRYAAVDQISQQSQKSEKIEHSQKIELELLSLRALCSQVKYSEAISRALKVYLRTLPPDIPIDIHERMHAQLLNIRSKTNIHSALDLYEIAKTYLDANPSAENHLLMSTCGFDYVVGELKRGDGSIVRAIRIALEEENASLFLGRLQAYTLSLLHQKRVGEAQKLLKYAIPRSKAGADRGVEAFLLNTQGMALAACGSHREAISFFSKCQTALPAWARGVDPGFWSESICSFSWLLLPQLALADIDTKKLKDGGLEVSHRVGLARLWAWLLIGRPCRALQNCPPFSSPFPRGFWRIRILRATACYHLADLDECRAECGRALLEIPDYQHNYRTRIQFLLSRVMLRRGDLRGAAKLVEEGLKSSKAHFYFPLIAEGHLLTARCIAAQKGELRKARAHCLRAHQLARDYERPLLHATIWKTQAGIEARLRKPLAARTCFGKALLILKERLLHVSPENRDGFRSMHIAPIEQEQEQLLGKNQTSFALFQRLPSAIDALQSTRTDAELAHKIVKLLSDDLSHLKAQFWLKTGESKPRQLAGHTTRRPSVPRMLDPSGSGSRQQDSSANEGGFSLSGSESAAAVIINAGIDRKGVLYFESETGELTEVEIDFLTCLGSIAEKQMVRLGRRPDAP